MLIDQGTLVLTKKAIKKNGWLEIPAHGNSMFPFIREGNICRFTPCEPFLLKKGDVILFYSRDKQLIAHRFVEVKAARNQALFIFKGDTNLGFDEPVKAEHILGKLVLVKKEHIQLTPDQFLTRLWGKLILSFPILSGILRQFLNRRFKLQF